MHRQCANAAVQTCTSGAAAIFPQAQMSLSEIFAECDGIAKFVEVNTAAGVPMDSVAAVVASHADQALMWTSVGLWVVGHAATITGV